MSFVEPKDAIVTMLRNRVTDPRDRGSNWIFPDKPRCFTDTAEVLSENGWKYIKDIKKEELVLTCNPKTLNLEYQPVLEKVEEYYKGDMIRIRNKWFDLLVTENHRMFIKTRWGINKFVTPLQLSLSNRIPRS